MFWMSYLILNISLFFMFYKLGKDRVNLEVGIVIEFFVIGIDFWNWCKCDIYKLKDIVVYDINRDVSMGMKIVN